MVLLKLSKDICSGNAAKHLDLDTIGKIWVRAKKPMCGLLSTETRIKLLIL